MELEGAELAVELSIADLAELAGVELAVELANVELAELTGAEIAVEHASAEIAELTGARVTKRRQQGPEGSYAERNSNSSDGNPPKAAAGGPDKHAGATQQSEQDNADTARAPDSEDRNAVNRMPWAHAQRGGEHHISDTEGSTQSEDHGGHRD